MDVVELVGGSQAMDHIIVGYFTPLPSLDDNNIGILNHLNMKDKVMVYGPIYTNFTASDFF